MPRIEGRLDGWTAGHPAANESISTPNESAANALESREADPKECQHTTTPYTR